MRVAKGALSGEEKAYHRSNSGSKQGQPSCYEVDAIGNPTELFRRINSGDWDGALEAVQINPTDASVWISRRRSNEDGLAWKYLPLHLICLQQRIPTKLLHALLDFYPQAASLGTPHDGNLPIHYVCESGCDDERVFAALLAACPAALEVKNAKGKTPLLLCHSKSRGILMDVLRQRKAPSLNDGSERSKREKKDRKKSRKADRRNEIDTTRKDATSTPEHRQQPLQRRPPQTTPARYVKHRRPTRFDDNDVNEPHGWEVETPRVSNNRRQSEKQSTSSSKDSSSFFTSSSASADDDTDTASYISSKTTEFVSTALNYLVPSSYQGAQPQEGGDETAVQDQVRSLTKENAAQRRAIEDLTKQLDRLNSSNEANTENSRLCERILAKAEADNVSFRSQIQQLRDEKEKMLRAADLKEREHQECMERMRAMICEKATALKIDVFDDGSSHRSSGSGRENDQITEALKTLMSHMDDRNANLHSTITTLEANLSKSEVSLKTIHSKCKILQGERDTAVKKQRELERKTTILEEEKEKTQVGLSDLKDRVSTLTVINHSLQEQVDSISNSQVKKENDQFKSELSRLNAKLAQMKDEKDSEAKIQYEEQVAEMEKKIDTLLEKNRSLKKTILTNNETYSKKVLELGEKYSTLEKANKDLRHSLAKKPVLDRAHSSLKVSLDEGGENKLLYEV